MAGKGEETGCGARQRAEPDHTDGGATVKNLESKLSIESWDRYAIQIGIA